MSGDDFFGAAKPDSVEALPVARAVSEGALFLSSMSVYVFTLQSSFRRPMDNFSSMANIEN